jgi:hypothetical protein
MGRTVIVVPGSQGTTMSLSVCRCDGAGYSSWVGVRVVVYTNVCPCYTLAYLRTEDRRFGIKLKEEGRIAIVSKVLGRSGGDAKRCMKTPECRQARVDTGCSSPPPCCSSRLFVR